MAQQNQGPKPLEQVLLEQQMLQQEQPQQTVFGGPAPPGTTGRSLAAVPEQLENAWNSASSAAQSGVEKAGQFLGLGDTAQEQGQKVIDIAQTQNPLSPVSKVAEWAFGGSEEQPKQAALTDDVMDRLRQDAEERLKKQGSQIPGLGMLTQGQDSGQTEEKVRDMMPSNEDLAEPFQKSIDALKQNKPEDVAPEVKQALEGYVGKLEEASPEEQMGWANMLANAAQGAAQGGNFGQTIAGMGAGLAQGYGQYEQAQKDFAQQMAEAQRQADMGIAEAREADQQAERQFQQQLAEMQAQKAQAQMEGEMQRAQVLAEAQQAGPDIGEQLMNLRRLQQVREGAIGDTTRSIGGGETVDISNVGKDPRKMEIADTAAAITRGEADFQLPSGVFFTDYALKKAAEKGKLPFMDKQTGQEASLADVKQRLQQYASKGNGVNQVIYNQVYNALNNEPAFYEIAKGGGVK